MELPEVPGGPVETTKEALDTGERRSGRRLVKVLSDLLPRLRAEGERFISISEAVVTVPWRQRVVLGSTWAFCHRVALVFSDRRLLEITLSPWGRRTTGLVRELSWASSPHPRFEGKTLSIGEGSRWWLNRQLDKAVVNRIEQAAKGEAAKTGRTVAARPWRLCPLCGVTVTTAGARCRSCGALWSSRRLAAMLSVAFPGAGNLFLKRPFFALCRLLLEVAVFVLIADQLLRSDTTARAVITIAVAIVLAVLLKTESVRMSQALADRAGTVTEAVVGRWRRFLAIGILLSLLAVAVPLLLGGATGTEISADLDAEVAHLGWVVTRSPDQRGNDHADPSLRAVWQQEQGLTVRARAHPLQPLERIGKARTRWLEAYRSRQPLELEELQLGRHQVIRVVERIRGGEAAAATEIGTQTEGTTGTARSTDLAEPAAEATGIVRLELLLFDDRGRDAHTLTTEVAGSELARADEQLRHLVRSMYWIDPQR